ncbi:MAG TPA: hypothetical protein VLS48_08925, partial [Anaerolineales bacterium]|nr:hypothetical protein [Anaerolineales bacterium]
MATKKSLLGIFALLLAASLVLGACQPQVQTVVETVVVTQEVVRDGETVIETVVVEKVVTPEPVESNEPVTLDWNWGTEPPTIDPALATDTTSVDVIRNIFISLTQFDPVSGEVQPYLATDWEAGEDADG